MAPIFTLKSGLTKNSYQHSRNPLLWLYPFPDRAVVAGLIATENGSPARDVPVSLRRIDAPSPYAATTTYYDDSVNSDEQWQENFAFDDVTAGYYELSVGTGKEKIKEEFWVYPYPNSFRQDRHRKLVEPLIVTRNLIANNRS